MGGTRSVASGWTAPGEGILVDIDAGFGASYLGMLKDLWVGYANADERTAHPVLEDGKTLDELIAPNDALGQHLMRTMRADGATDQEIWQFMIEN